MKKQLMVFLIWLFAMSSERQAFAQILMGVALPDGHFLVPANPTSADILKLSLVGSSCSNTYFYKSNPYRVEMVQNNIKVTLGVRTTSFVYTCFPLPREEIELGKLPAGNYTLTVNNVPSEEGFAIPPLFTSIPFTVTDARSAKVAPYVRLDYSGHWWDPADSGWGLFIWQDARASNDSLFAAWFSYTPDGKPMWYVFQPAWHDSQSMVTKEGPLMQTSRQPGPTSPPPNPTSVTVVGTASIDFTNYSLVDGGRLTYTFSGGAKQVRNIQRFKP